MKNKNRSIEEALNGSASSRQRILRQEGALCDVPIILEQRADSAQPSGSSSAPICRQLPRYLRRPRDNDDLIASINRTSEKLADCLAIAESAMAIVQGQSPPEANPVRERLAKAEARIAGETFTIIFCIFLTFAYKILITCFLNPLDLSAQLESLRLAADRAAGFVNAKGVVPMVCLHDIPNRVREVALHGVRYGAAMALAAAQVHSGHDLRLLPCGALATGYPRDYERLVEDFSDTANSVALTSQADDIVNKVFFGL